MRMLRLIPWLGAALAMTPGQRFDISPSVTPEMPIIRTHSSGPSHRRSKNKVAHDQRRAKKKRAVRRAKKLGHY